MHPKDSGEDPFKFPKRSLSVVYVAGSLLLLLFLVSIGVSTMQLLTGNSSTPLPFSVGKPFYTINGETALVSVPISFTNKGFFDLQNLEITTAVSDNGVQLINSTASIPNVAAQTQTTLTPNITINLPNFLRSHQSLLFNDTTLLLSIESVHVMLGGLLSVRTNLSSSIPFLWGAPLNGFNTSSLQFQLVNSTTTLASFNVNFNNHSFFPLEGAVSVDAFDGTEHVAGETLPLSIDSGVSFSSTVQLWLPTTTHVNHVLLTIQSGFFAWEAYVYG